jgi:hypothetical protein
MTKQVIDTVTVLNGIKAVPAMLAWFQPYLKNWHKQMGSKPTDAMLMVPLLWGKRPGVEALHIAMAYRAEGCTVAQFCLAGSCGPANNYRRALVKAGWATCTVEGKPYAFKLGFTAKGAERLGKAEAAIAEAVTVTVPAKAISKPKGKVKAKKAIKQPKAETPISEAPSVNEGQQLTVAENEQPLTEVELGGVDAEHDEVSQADLSALAAHFNQ